MRGNSRSLILILVLWAAGLCAAGQFAKIAVPFISFQALYPDAGSAVGWLLSLISLAGALFGLAAGALVHRAGLRRMLLAALILGGVLSLWQASLPGIVLFSFSRILEGASHLAIVIAAPTVIAQACSDRFRGPAMALWSTFFGVAFALVAWVGLPFVDGYGIPSLFIVHGGLMLGIAALLSLLLPRRDAAGPAVSPARGTSLFADLARACRSPRVAAPGAGWLFYTLTFVALLAVLPERLPPDQRDDVLGLLPLLGIIVSLTLVPLLMKVMGAATIVLIGFGAALLTLLLQGGLSLAALAVVLYTVLGLIQSGSFAAVPELNRSAQARALSFGLVAQTGNIGNLTGTPLLLFVLTQGGEADLLRFVALLYGCALGVLLLLRIGYRREAET